MTAPIEPLVSELLEKLPPDLREDFQERAAIVEFEAATSRQLAECLALLDVVRRHPSALLGLQAFRASLEGRTYVLLALDRASLTTRLAALGPATVQEVDLGHVVGADLGGVALVTRAF